VEFAKGLHGNDAAMLALLIILILALLIFGVVAAIKIAFWVLLIALAVSLVLALMGRGLFAR
jgi:hypothetical protein